MIYVVMGMHKSGTTLISSLLHHSGINMSEGVESRSYEENGFYERDSTYKVNLDLLGLKTSDILFFSRPSQLQMTPEQRQQMCNIIDSNMQLHQNWGFKDPRTTLTYPLWEQVLPMHQIIVVYRPVEDMWRRFKYSGKKFWKNFSRSIALVMRWCEYNQSVLAILENTSRKNLLVSYRELLTGDHEYQRLENFIVQPLVDTRKQILSPTDKHQPLIIKFAIMVVRLISRYDYNAILLQLTKIHHSQSMESN